MQFYFKQVGLAGNNPTKINLPSAFTRSNFDSGYEELKVLSISPFRNLYNLL
jgi:hypothetical protein